MDKSYKFLNTVAQSLAKARFPKFYCNNTQIIREMFGFLRMKPEFIKYFIDQFNQSRLSYLSLKNLTDSEINRLKSRPRGAAEFFKIINRKSGVITYFYIGPYSDPVVKCSLE